MTAIAIGAAPPWIATTATLPAAVVSTSRRCDARITVRRAAAFAFALLVAGGCRSTAPRVDPEYDVRGAEAPRVVATPARCDCNARVVTRPNEAAAMLDFYVALRTKSATGLRQELEEARREFAAGSAEAARIRLAMIQLLPGGAVRNEAQAAQLLEPYARGDTRAQSPFRGIAQLLLAQLDQARRFEAGAQAQAAKLREEQKRSDELQRKLDALKEVERAMIQKDQGVKTR